jgi:hypothetical protein
MYVREYAEKHRYPHIFVGRCRKASDTSDTPNLPTLFATDREGTTLMGFQAIRTDAHPLDADHMGSESWDAAVAYYRAGGTLTCPDCRHPMAPRRPQDRRAHFFHLVTPDRPCSNTGGESDEHRALKSAAEAAIHSAGYTPKVEALFPEFRADVVAFRAGRPVLIVEVQLSPQSYDITATRDAQRTPVAPTLWLCHRRPDGRHPWIEVDHELATVSGSRALNGEPVTLTLADLIRGILSGRVTAAAGSWIDSNPPAPPKPRRQRRPVERDTRAMLDKLTGGGPDRHAVECRICGHLMTRARQGAHTACLTMSVGSG